MTHFRPPPQNYEAALNCPECQAQFSMFVWKHMCRACGFYFCNACTQGRRKIPKFGYGSPQRVCNQCYVALNVEMNDVATLQGLPIEHLQKFSRNRSIDIADCQTQAQIVNRILQTIRPAAPVVPPGVPSYLTQSNIRTGPPPSSYYQTTNPPYTTVQSNGYPGAVRTNAPYPQHPLYTNYPQQQPQYPPGYVPPVRPPPSSPPTFDSLETTPVSELKAILDRYGVRHFDITEKHELVARVRETLEAKEREAAELTRSRAASSPSPSAPSLSTSVPDESIPSPSAQNPSTDSTASTKEKEIPVAPDVSASSQPQELDEKDLCVICLDAEIRTLFLECGHMACCIECSTKLPTCPICRRPITRVVNVFHANK